MQHFYLALFSVLITWNLSGQTYGIEINHQDHQVVRRWLNDQPPKQDSSAWIRNSNQLLLNLHQEGYLLAEFQDPRFSNDTFYLEVEPGRKVHWAIMKFHALEFLPAGLVNDLDVSGQAVRHQEWISTIHRVLESVQSEGYLFATYQLRHIEFDHDSLSAEVFFEPGLQIVLDTIEVEGTARLAQNYLQKTMGLQKGEPITPDDLELLNQHLNNLRFVQQYAPPVLILLKEKATIRTYLNNRNASAFDILAGLQPSSGPDQPASLTGYVELDLINQLSRGERVYLHLEKLRPRSQELEMALAYPYLLNLPFGVDGNFRLLKNDTLYSELEWKAGISLPWGKNQFVRAGITQQATNIITVNENTIIATKRLPTYVDLRVKGFTMGLSRNRLDYDLNPRRGYNLVADATFNQRRVRENDLITGLSLIDTAFDYSSLYDSLKEASTRIAFTARLEYFIPWGKRSTIRLGVDGGFLQSDDQLFSNELFRLGGYERLRGFDEESILAQYYSIFSAEYRLIIGGASYLSFFGDYGWVRSDNVENPYEDRPFGFGFGLNFETKAGIFGMRVAVGAQRGSAIDFDGARLHFGYINRF